jgi:crossover junction endodeoxyribonuclease RuvC
MRVLGIDPGSRITGYGIIDMSANQYHYVTSGCIRTGQGDLSARLKVIFEGVQEIAQTYNPEVMAIEKVFMHRNVDSALKLGHARGVAICACSTHALPLNEYSAREFKQAVVGYGGASKEQVQHMVCSLLSLSGTPQADAADALAVAVCHLHMSQGIAALAGQQAKRRRRQR